MPTRQVKWKTSYKFDFSYTQFPMEDYIIGQRVVFYVVEDEKYYLTGVYGFCTTICDGV